MNEIILRDDLDEPICLKEGDVVVVNFGTGSLKHMFISSKLFYDLTYQCWMVGKVPLSNILQANYVLDWKMIKYYKSKGG